MIIDADSSRPNLSDEIGLVYSLPPLRVSTASPIAAITPATVAMLRTVAAHWHFPSIATPDDIRAVADFLESLLKEQP